MAPNLTKEQNVLLGSLYKTGRKLIHLKSHVYFLSESLRLKFIPKCFHIKNNLPGQKENVQKQLDLVSFSCVKDEKSANEIKLSSVVEEFEILKEQLYVKFTPEGANDEIKRLEKHLKRVEKIREKAILKKIKRDCNFDNIENSGDVTLSSDDDEQIIAHRLDLQDQNFSVSFDSDNVTHASDDMQEIALNSGASLDLSDVTHVIDEDNNIAHKKRKKRRFKRRYLQPQLKRKRKRRKKSSFEDMLSQAQSEAWNLEWYFKKHIRYIHK